MKLGEFVGNLQQKLNDDPANAELLVVFSVDDEGNAFKTITFEPSIGEFDGDDGFQIDAQSVRNAICIN